MRVEEIQMLVADVVLPPPDITVSQWADEKLGVPASTLENRIRALGIDKTRFKFR